jgi:hypothetical protein
VAESRFFELVLPVIENRVVNAYASDLFLHSSDLFLLWQRARLSFFRSIPPVIESRVVILPTCSSCVIESRVVMLQTFLL